MRLIDADELQQICNETSTALMREPKLLKDIEHMVRAFQMTTEMIKDAPTIEAEPVKHGRWISTSAKTPPEFKTVIVSDGEYVTIGYMGSMGMWHIHGNPMPQRKGAYTYWQPLPEPPERSEIID